MESARKVKNEDDVVDAQAYLDSANALAARMHHSYFLKPKEENVCKDAGSLKKQGKKKLALYEKIDIIHDVLISK